MSQMRKLNGIVVAAIVAACAANASVALGQDLPKGEQLVDKYIQVTGGKEAYDKIKSRVASGTIEIAALGIKGSVAIYQAAPNKVLVESEIPNVLKDQKGTDGQVAWENNTTNGPRVLDGDEKAVFLRRNSMDGESNWRKYYKSAETKGAEKIDGKDCYVVEMTPIEGAKETQYYDKNTGLVVRSLSKEKTQVGEVDIESNMVEYRKVDGLTIPSKLKQKFLGNEIVISLDKIEHNAKIPDDKFTVPDDVKKLVDKAKESKK